MFQKILNKFSMRKEKLRILIPQELDREDYIGGVRDFHKVKETFRREIISGELNGKKVRYWKQVYKAAKRSDDLFVPIYWKVAEKKVRKDKNLFEFQP